MRYPILKVNFEFNKKLIIGVIFLLSIQLLKAQQTEIIDVIKCGARIFINSEDKTVSGLVAYKFDVLKPIDSFYIDAKDMEFNVTFSNRGMVETSYDGKRLTVKKSLDVSTNNEIVLGFTAKPKKAFYFVGWEDDAPNQVWTQGQGKYTSNWLPSFDDENEKIEFDLSIAFDDGYDVISNGAFVGKEPNEDKIQWRFDMKKPMSSYLLALVIGNYDKKTEVSNSGIPLEMYYYPQDSIKVEPTYRYTKKIFDYLEEEIGFSYPWEHYKQIPVHDFLYAGMENTGATIFADTFVIDSIAFNDRNYVNVNAHELAHQWFGNLVTAKSGEHHWLQEGFSTYYALLAEREVFGKKYFLWKLYEYAEELKNQDQENLGSSLLNPKASSLTFYKRGSWVLYALRDKVGDEVFKKAIKEYLTRFQFGSATTSDFIIIVERLSKTELKEFTETWIESESFPFDLAHQLLMKHPFIQEYEMVDCEAANSKCREYLQSYISDEAKIKVILQQPSLITKETFKNSITVRRAIAEVLTTVPKELKKEYESLLDDNSYYTKEKALHNLWNSFPKGRENYLNKTKDIDGLNYNLKQLWLVLALSTSDYNEELKNTYFKELTDFTSAKYNFEVRISAFQYLAMLNVCKDACMQNLEEATSHHNWRLSKYAKEQLKSLKNKS